MSASSTLFLTKQCFVVGEEEERKRHGALNVKYDGNSQRSQGSTRSTPRRTNVVERKPQWDFRRFRACERSLIVHSRGVIIVERSLWSSMLLSWLSKDRIVLWMESWPLRANKSARVSLSLVSFSLVNASCSEVIVHLYGYLSHTP